MRTTLIESHINRLRTSFGPVRKSVEEEELRVLYNAKDYPGMIRYIRNILHLGMKIRLGLVNTVEIDPPAWIEVPTPLPPYGSVAFQQTTVVMYLTKPFLHEGSFEQVVLAIAHELCHIVLYATGHALQTEEEAVDLTAMLLGFRDMYVTGCRYTFKKDSCREVTYTAGYLTFEEVNYAARYMTFR